MDPFAPIPRAPSAPATGAACPSCGQPMDPSTASIDATGQLICRSCAGRVASAAASRTLTDQDPTTSRNLYGASAASAGLGIVSCCASGVGSWFFVVTLMPIASGATVLYLLATRPEARASVGRGMWLIAAMASVGVGFGLLGLMFGLFVVAGMVDGRF